jgi:hypothetical protein
LVLYRLNEQIITLKALTDPDGNPIIDATIEASLQDGSATPLPGFEQIDFEPDPMVHGNYTALMPAAFDAVIGTNYRLVVAGMDAEGRGFHFTVPVEVVRRMLGICSPATVALSRKKRSPCKGVV